MADLGTTYLGLRLPHPLVASASPVSRSLDGIRALEDAGAAAIVLFSLFEEQIRRDSEALEHLTAIGTHSFAEALSFFPPVREEIRPHAYLDLVAAAKRAVRVPVIASLNGATASGWTRYARMLQDAGADAIELNVFHIPSDPTETGAAVEQRYVDVVAAVRSAVSIPLAVKLGPYFSAFGDMARRLVAAGADALVLFNRFYQPDLDLESLQVDPTLELSTRAEIRLPLLWLALLRGRIPASLAASTGVESAEEVVKYLLAGADVVMTTSAVLRHGVDRIGTLHRDLDRWLDARGYASVAQVRGLLSHGNAPHPEAYERSNYIRVLDSWKHAYVP